MKNIDVHSNNTENHTKLTEFILLGLSSDSEVQLLLFFVFLIIYATTLIGNSVIIFIIRTEMSLQTPMFFFLSHLAIVDISYSSVTVPKLLETLISMKKSISLVGCMTQIFFFVYFACIDVFLLSAMAYDRYVAICDPLHYSIVMTKPVCWKLVGGAWVIAFLDATLNTMPFIGLKFCENNLISHFTCELSAVLSLSCSDTSINYKLILASCFLFGFTSFFLTMVSYIYIISSILKIQSTKGRIKAFSTCSSHLIVACLFYLSAFSRYLQPHSKSFTDLDKVSSIQYLILTPMLNPIIYSLKNRELKVILWKRFGMYK
uniref:Olfactory receptor n=1 Tax=Pogona vitticeps TaxID=103695 RepID=A0ABM5GM08_9SAUR